MNKYKKIFKKIKNIEHVNFFHVVRLSVKKQTFFAKRLSFLVKSGVPLVDSMVLIREQTQDRNEKKILEKIISDVRNGKSLADSLARCRGTFSNFVINIIKAGERGGTLTDNLNYLAEELKKKEILRKKILSALLYPIIVTIATFGITGFLIMYIFPKILPIFQSLNAELPLTTKMIIFLVNVIKNHGISILIVLLLATLIFCFLKKKNKKFKFILDGLILRLPIVGSIAQNYNLTNSNRTLGLLLKSGLSVTEALLITSDTIENSQYKKAFNDISHGVIKGKNISDRIKEYSKLFPDMLGHMIAVGEKTGNLSNTLIYLSEFYENEFDEQTKNLSNTIEPVLMIIMGIMVGFVAISVITPIYEITNNLKR